MNVGVHLKGCPCEANSPANKVTDVENEFQRQLDNEWKKPCKVNLFAWGAGNPSRDTQWHSSFRIRNLP